MDQCDFIEIYKIIDLPLIGRKFTWYGPENKRSRLDRFLVDEFLALKYKLLLHVGLYGW